MKPRQLSSLAALSIVGGMLVVPLTAAPAFAADVDFAIAVAKDGNGPFTHTAVPGGDTDDGNGIVRTNDAITYTVSVSSNAGPSANERFTVTAPGGTSWAGVPSLCSGSGSGISGQDLTCNVGNLDEGNTVNVPVLLNIGGGLANGTEITVTGTVTADDADNGPVAATSPITTVSASARYDLQKNTTESILTAGVTGPNGVDGVLIEYPMVIAWKPNVPGQGLLGYERSAGTFEFTDDVSQMYGGDPSPAVLFDEDGAAACGLNDSSHFPYLPAGRGGAPRAVVDSGTISCTQTAPGDPIQVSFTGNDSSDPFAAAQSAIGLPITGGSQAFVAVAYIRVWVPTPPAGSSFIARNTYTSLQTTSISGAENYPGETEPLENNFADRNLSSFAGVGGYKYLGQVADADSAPVTNAGSAKVGSPFVTEGQVLRSHVNLSNLGTARLTNAIACDTFDNRTQRLRSVPGYGGYTYTSSWLPGVNVQYAAYAFSDPASAQKQTCGNTDATWYNDPADVPGGIDAIGMVRAVGNVDGGRSANLFTLTEVKQASQNTRSYDFGHVNGGETSDGSWTHDGTDPDVGAGPYSDSVIITQNLARITKKIVDPGYSADDTPDQTSFTVAGNSVDYALYPTLTNSTTGGRPTTVTVRDVLPFNTTYSPDSASITPTSIEPYIDQQGRTRTQLVWELTNVTANDPIDPITYTVNVSPLAQAETVNNYARIESPSDVSELQWRDANRNVRIVTAGGVGVAKSAVAPVVINGDELTWNLAYTNTDVTDIDGVDIIDVLPSDGDRNNSDIHGDAYLAAPIDVDETAGETALYTTADPESISIDSDDPSNQVGGSTTWCAEVEFGDSACPSNLEDVTAVRIQRTTPVAGGAVVSHELTMRTVGAHDGDTLVNRFGLRASNLALPVQSNPASITVVSGSIGDYVWEDINENGLQDADEPALKDVQVELSGTNDRGDAVTATTRSNADGSYSFTGLRPGTYTVAFTGPSGGEFTVQHAGTDPAVDSDPNTGGVTDPIELATELTAEGNLAGVTSNLDIDAGVIPDETDSGTDSDSSSSADSEIDADSDAAAAADSASDGGGSSQNAEADGISDTGVAGASDSEATGAGTQGTADRPASEGGLANTGGAIGGSLAAGIALLLIGALLLVRRRKLNSNAE